MGSANGATAVGALALMQQLKLTKVALAYDAVRPPRTSLSTLCPASPRAWASRCSRFLSTPPLPTSRRSWRRLSRAELRPSGASKPSPAAQRWSMRHSRLTSPGRSSPAPAPTSSTQSATRPWVSTRRLRSSRPTRAVALRRHQEAPRRYEALMAAAGQEKNSTSNSIAAFGAWEELASVMRGMDGDITAESVSAALAADADIPGGSHLTSTAVPIRGPTSRPIAAADVGVAGREEVRRQARSRSRHRLVRRLHAVHARRLS